MDNGLLGTIYEDYSDNSTKNLSEKQSNESNEHSFDDQNKTDSPPKYSTNILGPRPRGPPPRGPPGRGPPPRCPPGRGPPGRGPPGRGPPGRGPPPRGPPGRGPPPRQPYNGPLFDTNRRPPRGPLKWSDLESNPDHDKK